MTRNYYIEVKLGTRWTLLHSTKRHVDALHYLKEHHKEYNKYPVRIIREVRTIVFDGSK